MGFIKDLHTLTKQGKALREQYPVQVLLAQAATQMDAASAMMRQATQQQAGGERLLSHGVDAVAVVTGARQSNALLNHAPMVELDLLVTMPNGVPVPVTRTEVVALLHLPRAQVGQRLAVRVDALDPTTLWINWSAPAPP
jgi:uncharacterized membrane protein